MAKRKHKSAADLAEEVLPVIGSAIEDVYDKTAPIVRKGRKLAKAKMRQERERAAAALQPTVEAIAQVPTSARKAVTRKTKKKRSGTMLKKLLVLAGLVAVGGFVARKLRGSSGGNWQSSYTPTPAPTASRRYAATADAEDLATVDADLDLAAATPDEALSDRASEPHPDTTPDDPAEVVELSAFADNLDAAPEAGTSEGDAAPYGEDSALALPGGGSPGPAYTVKGTDSKLFHTTESPSYEQIVAEVWFTNEVAAQAAGFRHWKSAEG